MSPIRRLMGAAAAVGAVALSVALFATATPASATGLGGTATPTDTSNTPISFASPQTATTFQLNLALAGGPNGPGGLPDECAADSASGNTTSYSYMIPQYTDPGTEVVSGGSLSIGNGLYAAGNSQWDSGNHNVASGTAQVSEVVYSWQKTTSHVKGGIVPSGQNSATYEIGMLCWNGATAQVTDWWNTECTFTAPNATLMWQCVDGPPSTPPLTPESPLTIGLPLGGAAVLGTGVFVTTRRRRRVVPA